MLSHHEANQKHKLKGGGHVHFHNTFLAPMHSLGDVKTQNNILKILKFIKVMKISCKHMPKCAKICIVMVSFVCGIASQGVQTMKRNRFYSENKFAK